jgi:SAM-dependent methyltransferase
MTTDTSGDWTAGYVADIGYTYGYYRELNPLRVGLAFANAGLLAPAIATACELGFGQGVSVNLHAAASGVRWMGTDFNPSQAAFARELAQASGSGAQLFDESFAEFCGRADLPEFDFIGLHGIWSWISDDNRATIVDFVRRRLRVGGVLYISYNTMPGWAAFAPMRHLMTQHAEVLGAEGRGIVSRIDGAIDFAERLMAVNPLFARANPQVAERIKQVKGHNRHYLAHEYFNLDWHPMHFATMAEWLAPAKVQYACSAHLLDHVDPINLTAEQQAFLAEIPDRMFRESARDFLVNAQFRRDYWVKGARQLNPLERVETLRAQRLVLTQPRAEVSLKVAGAAGEAQLQESVYGPLLDTLSDYRSRTVGEMEAALAGRAQPAQIHQAVMVLAGNGALAPAQPDGADPAVARASEAINRHLEARARGSGDVSYLASPTVAGGVTVGRFQQLFLAARRAGAKDAGAMARSAWTVLAAQGQRLVKDGKTLESEQDNIAELTQQAEAFLAGVGRMLEALGVTR